MQQCSDKGTMAIILLVLKEEFVFTSEVMIHILIYSLYCAIIF